MMKTRTLYYEDCHLARFTARVLSCQQMEGGFLVELDRTAFYPEGGGQGADTGTLGSVRVLDTQEVGDRVLHRCDGPLTVGQTVDGAIDYNLRLHRMQQHTGEHILSGLVFRRYGFHNSGFHMGADSVQVDFDGEIPAEDLPELERQMNEAIWADIPLNIWTPAPEELPGIVYRTKRELPWPVRIVQVPGYDSCACCGIHVERTGEVGLGKLMSCVRFRGGVRIEALWGRRAFEFLSRSHEQNLLVSRAFSAKLLETGEAAQKMNETLGTMKQRLGALERQIFASIAGQCRGLGDVLVLRPGLDNTGVRQLADQVAAVCGGTAAVLSEKPGGYSYCLVSRDRDLRMFNREMNAALAGRGGGKPECVQGSLGAERDAVLAYFHNYHLVDQG